jgi:hypothetical protein
MVKPSLDKSTDGAGGGTISELLIGRGHSLSQGWLLKKLNNYYP